MGRDFTVGDLVVHKRYPQWGVGKVIEVWKGNLPGGRAYVKVAFEDGKVRVFDGDLRSSTCCLKGGLMRLKGGD